VWLEEITYGDAKEGVQEKRLGNGDWWSMKNAHLKQGAYIRWKIKKAKDQLCTCIVGVGLSYLLRKAVHRNDFAFEIESITYK